MNTDKKFLKKRPYWNPKMLEQIPNWKPWEPSVNEGNDPSEDAYLRYLGEEQKLIEEQEELGRAISDEGSVMEVCPEFSKEENDILIEMARKMSNNHPSVFKKIAYCGICGEKMSEGPIGDREYAFSKFSEDWVSRRIHLRTHLKLASFL